MLEEVDPTLAGPIVYFQATVAQMGVSEIPNDLVGYSNTEHLNSFFFKRNFLAYHWQFDRNCSKRS